MLKEALEYEKAGYSVIPVKPDKVSYVKWEPYQKQKASPEQIREWWKKWPSANIGIITGQLSNLLVIDIDTPEATARVQEMLPEALEVPCQTTPSGGMHFVFEHIPGLPNRARIQDGIDLRTEGGYFVASPSVNGNGKSWQWIVSPLDVKPPPAPSPVLQILKKALDYNNIKDFNYLLYKENVTDELQGVTSVTNSNIFFSEGRRDEDLFSVANALIKTKKDEHFTLYVLDILAKYACDPPFDLVDTQLKVRSAIERAKRKERRLTQEIRDWVSVTNGNISVTLAYQELQIVTSEEKAKARVIFKRLCDDEKLIERVGEMDGWYRLKQTKIEEMEWWKSKGKEVSFVWPFGLENHYRTLPKNIIVVAGAPDGGKTAFLLNFCVNNMDKHEIYYFTSEASEEEIDDRLSLFGIPNYREKFRRVKFFPRVTHFEDVIKPNDINIIDYMEMPEEPWKISVNIRKIHDKLENGIAIIALQKPFSRDVARGGEGTLEKPKLYIAITKDDYGDNLLKIIKCKNWRDRTRNPNGLGITFKIVAGCKLIQESEWGINWKEKIRR